MHKNNSLSFEIFPGRYLEKDSSVARYNLIFEFWEKFWIDVMRDNGTTERIDSYDFLRSDLVAAIMNGDEVVSIHLYTLLRFEQGNIHVHPYFSGESGDRFYNELKRVGIESAMTLEYLTVNPGWRKSRLGYSLAPVVVGLGYQIQKQLGIDATLGRCRQDNGVNRLMTDVGGEALVRDVMMYNTPTDFCIVHRDSMTTHPDQDVSRRVESLWASRLDHTGQLGTSLKIAV